MIPISLEKIDIMSLTSNDSGKEFEFDPEAIYNLDSYLSFVIVSLIRRFKENRSGRSIISAECLSHILTDEIIEEYNKNNISPECRFIDAHRDGNYSLAAEIFNETIAHPFPVANVVLDDKKLDAIENAIYTLVERGFTEYGNPRPEVFNRSLRGRYVFANIFPFLWT